jgi:predicted nuclease with RNAse H fold
MPREFPARRGNSVFYKGKTLLSRLDPVAQAEKLVSQIQCTERTLYFCPSPLYGYGLDGLLKKLKNNSAVLCVESDAALYDLSLKNMAALLEREKQSGKLALCKVNDENDAPQRLCATITKLWGGRRFRRVELLRLGGGWQLFPELYEKMEKAARRDMALRWGNAMTLIRLGRLYCRNFIKNIALIPKLKSIGGLSFGNAPLLVLGAGPSLDGLLSEIENFFRPVLRDGARRTFKIICVDTCLSALKDRDIRPDLVVVLESQHWNLSDFTGCKGWAVPLAFDLSALPSSSRVLDGETWLYWTPWTEIKLFGRLEKRRLLPSALNPLGSVGLSAVEIARRLSSGPLVIGGLDFSYTPGLYHARATPGHKVKLFKTNRFRPVLNAEAAFRTGTFPALSKIGSGVRSDPAMRNYRSLFEEEFAADKRIFDIQGPGLPLGLKILTIEEACGILSAKPDSEKKTQTVKAELNPALKAAAEEEAGMLARLRDLLSGETTGPQNELWGLLDDLDYLWAHFPEYAGTGKRPPPSLDISFLKRVRAEIDLFLKLWNNLIHLLS